MRSLVQVQLQQSLRIQEQIYIMQYQCKECNKQCTEEACWVFQRFRGYKAALARDTGQTLCVNKGMQYGSGP